MVGAGDCRRREIRIGKLVLDEGAHPYDQHPLGNVRRQPAAAVQPAGECNGEQIERGCSHSDSARHVEMIQMAGKLACRRCEEGTGSVVCVQADCSQLRRVIGAKRQELARESNRQDAYRR
jgi:hypothetical protein